MASVPAQFPQVQALPAQPLSTQSQPAQPLPVLRQELRIDASAPDASGAPCWTLFDPLRHVFFQLGKLEYVVLTHWASGTTKDLAAALEREGVTGEEASELLSSVIEFGVANNLVKREDRESIEALNRQRQAMQKSWWRWLVDNYLFIRIPLVKPDAFLKRTLPRVQFLFARGIVVAFVLGAVLGLYLVSRQWDAFITSFLYFFSFEGLIAYGLGLAVVKVIHELGHAYMAARFGCRVPTMGVALLVMMPMLYTDTTSAWRLRSRRQRLMIDCAGIMAELGVAVIATLAWVVLPEGSLRSVAFILATTSWVMSLAINTSPFMRFDGYYVLSDLTGIPNLQSRAFALGRWKLREVLFDLRDPPPEDLPRHTRNWMVVYAYATWLYRLILFIGIALLVYHMFFKALGIILFVVEIMVFVARPIMTELKQWNAMRDRIKASRRTKRLAIAGGIVFLLLALPTDTRISAPAILSTVKSQPMIAGEPALLTNMLVSNGQAVKAGTIIAQLTSSDIDREIARTKVRIAQLEAQSGRATADDEDRANLLVLRSDLAGQRLSLAGLLARRQKLVLVAPSDGVIADVPLDMTPGRWLGGRETIARLISPNAYDVQAYVKEGDLWRLEAGAGARFVPDDPVQRSRAARLDQIAAAATENIVFPMLGSSQGGPIPVDEETDGGLKPREAIYRIHLVTQRGRGTQARLEQQIPGVIVISASPSSPLIGFLRTLGRVWHSEGPM